MTSEIPFGTSSGMPLSVRQNNNEYIISPDEAPDNKTGKRRDQSMSILRPEQSVVFCKRSRLAVSPIQSLVSSPVSR